MREWGRGLLTGDCRARLIGLPPDDNIMLEYEQGIRGPGHIYLISKILRGRRGSLALAHMAAGHNGARVQSPTLSCAPVLTITRHHMASVDARSCAAVAVSRLGGGELEVCLHRPAV